MEKADKELMFAWTTNSSQATEITQLETRLEEERKAGEAAEVGKQKAEKDLVDLNASLPELREKIELKASIQCSRQVNEIKGEVYQEGYDFALNELHLPIDHPMHHQFIRSNSDNENEEEGELADDLKDVQLTENPSTLPTEGQGTEGLGDNNAPTTEKDHAVSLEVMADQDDAPSAI